MALDPTSQEADQSQRINQRLPWTPPVYDDLKPAEWSLQGEDLREYIQKATNDFAALVRTTFGPKGMEKLIQTQDTNGDSEHVVTSDGAELLAAIERGDGFNHPISALIVDYVDSLQRGLRDGTTTSILLTQALLNHGFEMIDQGLQPGNLVVGYGIARSRVGETLDQLARPVAVDNEHRLQQIASTSITSDLDADARDRYSQLIADAVIRLHRSDDMSDVENIKTIVTNTLDEGFYSGLILKREPAPIRSSDDTYRGDAPNTLYPDLLLPHPIQDATVAIIHQGTGLEDAATQTDENSDSQVSRNVATVNTVEQFETFASGRNERISELAQHLATLGVDVVVSQPEIEDRRMLQALIDAGIGVVDNVKYPKSDIHRLARATGASVVPTLRDVQPETVGTAGMVRNHSQQDEVWTLITGCDGPISTLVLNADTASGKKKIERLVEDGIRITSMAVTDQQMIPGAGSAMMALISDLEEYAPAVSDREQLAIEAFAAALEDLISTLITNCGHDAINVVSSLREAHASADEPVPIGIDSASGELIDAYEEGIIEPRRVSAQAIETAGVATEQLLTLDAILHPGIDLSAISPQTEHD